MPVRFQLLLSSVHKHTALAGRHFHAHIIKMLFPFKSKVPNLVCENEQFMFQRVLGYLVWHLLGKLLTVFPVTTYFTVIAWQKTNQEHLESSTTCSDNIFAYIKSLFFNLYLRHNGGGTGRKVSLGAGHGLNDFSPSTSHFLNRKNYLETNKFNSLQILTPRFIAKYS